MPGDGVEKRAVSFSHISGLAFESSISHWLVGQWRWWMSRAANKMAQSPLGSDRNQGSGVAQEGKRQGSNRSMIPTGGQWLSKPPKKIPDLH